MRDQETGAHVRRIGLYASKMATAIGWDKQLIDDIRIAAPMHDIGKIGIPDAILLKPGKLDSAEYEIMKTHSKIGADMLSNTDIPMMMMASEIALSHHERWDGTGYPHQLAGTDIPESARITSLCDVYDALSHERIYKRAFSESETIEIMTEQSGKSFDPELFEVFMQLLPEFREIRLKYQDPEPDNSVQALSQRAFG